VKVFDVIKKHELRLKSFTKLYNVKPQSNDPFSDEYRDWELAFFDFLSGKSYKSESEGFVNDLTSSEEYIKSDVVTKFNKEIIAKLDIKKGQRVIEMGFGYGELLEELGRLGCSVSGIDASEYFVQYVSKLLSEQKIDADINRGLFFDIENLHGTFDVIIFKSSFHHCGDPVGLTAALTRKLSPGGRIVFIGEVIANYYHKPWGVVCYDGETAMRIRANGWLELGMRTDFFKSLLLRNGLRINRKYMLSEGSVMYEITAIPNNSSPN
jgi:2-polyprenyl-3-methyl-5-hydroxy-6-metoxy-1,4-benzoquinol methylase